MNKRSIFVALAAVVGLSLSLSGWSGDLLEPNDEPDVGFAVVELFTSEGCSSCPPADGVLADLAKQAEDQGRPVYALAFHVDYWDRLGWPDPFANRAFTQRQRNYARAMNSRTLYTPQVIVNGKNHFVGSHRGPMRTAVAKALATPAQLTVGAKATANAEARVANVDITLEGAPDDAVVHVAVVEDGLRVEVTRGENRGRTLAHEAVVRAFTTVNTTDLDRPVRLTWPEGVNLKNASVITYVQQGNAGRILAASRAPLQADDGR